MSCSVPYRKSGLVKSRNSVIVMLERWRVRSSLFDLLASCSAVLTTTILCFLLVGFYQSAAWFLIQVFLSRIHAKSFAAFCTW